MTAAMSECEDCVVRNSVAETGSSVEVKEPGIIRMSNCGALAKEFCPPLVASPLLMQRTEEQGACGNLYLLARLSQLAAKQHHGNPARPGSLVLGQGGIGSGLDIGTIVMANVSSSPSLACERRR